MDMVQRVDDLADDLENVWKSLAALHATFGKGVVPDLVGAKEVADKHLKQIWLLQPRIDASWNVVRKLVPPSASKSIRVLKRVADLFSAPLLRGILAEVFEHEALRSFDATSVQTCLTKCRADMLSRVAFATAIRDELFQLRRAADKDDRREIKAREVRVIEQSAAIETVKSLRVQQYGKRYRLLTSHSEPASSPSRVTTPAISDFELTEARKLFRLSPTTPRKTVMKQLAIGAAKATAIINIMRREGLCTTRPRTGK